MARRRHESISTYLGDMDKGDEGMHVVSFASAHGERSPTSPTSAHNIPSTFSRSTDGSVDDGNTPLLSKHHFRVPSIDPQFRRKPPVRKSSIRGDLPIPYPRRRSRLLPIFFSLVTVVAIVSIYAYFALGPKRLLADIEEMRKPAGPKSESLLEFPEKVDPGPESPGMHGNSTPPKSSPGMKHEWWKPKKMYSKTGEKWKTTGGDGSLVMTETGDTFVYRNNLQVPIDSILLSFES